MVQLANHVKSIFAWSCLMNVTLLVSLKGAHMDSKFKPMPVCWRQLNYLSPVWVSYMSICGQSAWPLSRRARLVICGKHLLFWCMPTGTERSHREEVLGCNPSFLVNSYCTWISISPLLFCVTYIYVTLRVSSNPQMQINWTFSFSK